MGGRLPVEKVIEHRISFGTKERVLIEDISTSIRIASLPNDEILKILDDPTKIIEILYSLATIAEIIGFETGLPTVADVPEVYEWFAKRANIVAKKAGENDASAGGLRGLIQTIVNLIEPQERVD